MSIENTLERIATSLEKIAKVLEHSETYEDRTTVHGVWQMPVTETVPAPAAAVPAAVPVPAPAPAVPAAPVPPAVPSVPVPAAVPAGPTSPFSDTKSLMAYCMEKYKVLGPAKGGMIQQVLIEMGVNNLSALTAAQYGEFYRKVEAI